MKKLLVFNWKMNPGSRQEAEKLTRSVLEFSKKSPKQSKLATGQAKKAEIVICPPFIYLTSLSKILNLKSSVLNLSLGAQNVFWANEGAYTGEISPLMLKNLGIEYVIVGHSERRRYLGETDEMINKKIRAALAAGLKVILCVGEDLKIRRRGKKAVMGFVRKQLEKDLKGIKSLVISHKSLVRNLTVAYEPIWAIGTGIPCKPEDAREMIKFIKELLKSKTYNLTPKVLYGGSVNSKNIESFIKYKEIDGALVGGASLKPEEIKKIIAVAGNA